MSRTLSTPTQYRRQVDTLFAHTGRCRAAMRSLAQDVEYILDHDGELTDPARNLFAHDLRRAARILNEIKP